MGGNDAMILITGATGNIGSALLEQYRAKGAPSGGVRALTRGADKVAELRAGGVEAAIGDFDHPDTLPAALEGVDAALLNSGGDPRQAEGQNAFIDAAKRAGVRRIVKISALGASADSPIVFGRWHAETEAYLKASGLEWTILQPSGFMQNLLQDAPGIAATGTLYAPAGDGRVGWIDVRDIAAVAAVALSDGGHTGQTYPLTGAQALSWAEVAQALSTATGKEVRYQDVPPEAFGATLRGHGVPEFLVGALLSLYAVYRAGYAATVTDDVRRVTGSAPRTLAQFAADHAAAFRGA